MVSPDQIKHAATAAGFDLAGVASVRDEDFPELAAFPEWIEAGHAGEMKYLEKRTETGELRRERLENHGPWARPGGRRAANYQPDAPYSPEVPDAEPGWRARHAQRRPGNPHS